MNVCNIIKNIGVMLPILSVPISSLSTYRHCKLQADSLKSEAFFLVSGLIKDSDISDIWFIFIPFSGKMQKTFVSFREQARKWKMQDSSSQHEQCWGLY